MAKLNIEKIFDTLDPQLRKALDATLRAHFSSQEYNSRSVFKTWKTEIGKKCKSWQSVPNKYIRSE